MGEKSPISECCVRPHQAQMAGRMHPDLGRAYYSFIHCSDMKHRSKKLTILSQCVSCPVGRCDLLFLDYFRAPVFAHRGHVSYEDMLAKHD